jgi:hypothetical protein
MTARVSADANAGGDTHTPRSVIPRFALENHVIPAKAGIHCVPDQQWTPAFAGVTKFMCSQRAGPANQFLHSASIETTQVYGA